MTNDSHGVKEPLLCRLGLHRNVYDRYIEFGIIDGPPPKLARLTCTRCGRTCISRSEVDRRRAWGPLAESHR